MSNPTPEQLEYMKEHMTDDKRSTLLALNSVFFPLALIAVLLRLLARRRLKAPWKADDWLIVAAVMLDIGPFVSSLFSIHYGFGQHVILVTNPVGLVKSVLAGEILYCCIITLTKASILFLYRRIFTTNRYRKVLITTGSFVVLFQTAQLLGLLLQCIPLSAMWTGHTEKCFPINPFFISTAIINSITDIVILCLPIPTLWKLKISHIQKAQLFVTFATGGCACVCSVLRTVEGVNPAVYDFSWGGAVSGMWSLLELNVAIISACLPTLRPLFFPKNQTKSKILIQDTNDT